MPEPTFNPDEKIEFRDRHAYTPEPRRQWDGLWLPIAIGIFVGLCAFGIVTGIISAIVVHVQVAEANKAIKSAMKTWQKPTNYTPQQTMTVDAPNYKRSLGPNERCMDHHVLVQVGNELRDEPGIRCGY